MTKTQAGNESSSGSSQLKPLRSLSSRLENSNDQANEKLGRAQRVCKLLLERHGDRIIQLLLDSKDGQALLKKFLALSFSASDCGEGNLLKRLLERAPESVVPLLLKKSDDRLITRSLGACLVSGISAMEAHELKPVASALAESVMEQLQDTTVGAAEITDTAEKLEQEATEATAVGAPGDSGPNSKRSDDETTIEDMKRRPSRVQELIEQQQRRCREKEERVKCRTASSGSADGAADQDNGMSSPKGRICCFRPVMKEALVFATSEVSSAEVEELCDQLVNFAPAVLTRVIQIEVSQSISAERQGSIASPDATQCEKEQRI